MDEWLMKWNRVCPVCKRVILRNERSEEQEVEETDATSPEAGVSASGSSTDNISDSRTVESIPLLVSVHDPTESRTHRYGSVAESNVEGSGGQHLLESFASMQDNTVTQEPEESAGNGDNLQSAESDNSATA